jgi:outer membrane protein assembly factor BamB
LNSRILLTRRELIKLGLLTAIAPRTLFSSRAPWSFVVFSDTHFGVAGNVERNDALLREIAGLAPAFAFDVGDLTERAWPEEFDQATRAFASLPFKVLIAPGNHDVRWAPGGPLMFEQRAGPMHQLVQHQGCAFLMLDSTVPLSHFGHIGGPQQRWIAEKLSTIAADTPVFVFFHHPMGRPGGIDDEIRLARALAPYNAKVVFTAHGHADLLWDWNGVVATMNKGLYQGSYQYVTVDPNAGVIRIARRTTEKPQLTPIAEIPLARQPRATPIAFSETGESAPTGALQKVWEQPLGGGVMSELVIHQNDLYISGMDGVLYAFAADDGRPRWQARTGGYIHSTPAIAGPSVIVGSADGSVYAFARASGKPQWRLPTQGPVYGSAGVAKGIVAIASGDGSVYGIDARSGKVRWQYTLDPGPSAFAQSPAVTDGERFFIGAWDQNVYALDAKTGKEVWRYRATERGFYFSAAIARPVLDDGRLFVPSNDNTLHCIDTRLGSLIWNQSAPGDKFGYSSPTFANGRIYIGSLGDQGQVHCLDATTGQIMWTTATGSTIYESSPALLRDKLAIGSVNGLLSLIQLSDGAIVGTYRFPAGLFLSTPAAAGNRVYAATFAEKVVAFEL